VMTRVADPTSLAEGMRRVVMDDGLRETLIRGGRSVSAAFSWERAAEEHARLYAEMTL
jgi:glycosyltransferase involved in cell wall biosynthesis